MSFRAATGAVLGAALLLTASCGGGSKRPPRATLGPEFGSESPIRFEDLPVTRLPRERVPQPNATHPSLGPPKAPVLVQVWSDFECSYCADVHPVLQQMRREYAGRTRLVWHDYPLPFHAHARLAANAGREAFAQGGADAFWKFHDALYEAPASELDAPTLERLASRIGLDRARFRVALGALNHDAEIARDLKLGGEIGVEGTPAFLVNDYFFVGAVPIEILRVIVERALADASP